MSRKLKELLGISWLLQLLASLVMAAVVLTLLQPRFSFAKDHADLIDPNRNFVQSEQEARFIRSLPPLRVMIDDNFVPLSSYDSKTKSFNGLSVDLFRHVAGRLGLKYQLLQDAKLTWSDKVELFNKQKVDLLMPVSFTEERASNGIFTSSFYNTYYGVIVKKTSNFRIKKTADLALYKIGVTKSSAIIPFVLSSVPGAQVMYYENQKELYQAVRVGEIDVALQNKNVFHDDRFNLRFVDLIMPYTIMEYPRRYSYYLNKVEPYHKLAAIMDRYLAGVDYNRLITEYERSEDELILRYIEQENQKKLLVYGIAGSLALLVLLGIAYQNHRRFSEKLEATLEQVNQQKMKLQKSEEKFRGLFDNSRDALLILEHPSWKFTSGNQAAVDMFWVNNEEDFLSHGPWEFSPERQPDGSASNEKAIEMMEIALRDGYHLFEWTHRRIGGEVFLAEVFLTRIEEGEKVALQATVRDITYRKRAEETLREKKKQLKDIIDFLPDATLAIDKEKRVIIWNRAIEEMTGVPAEEMIGRGDYAYTIPFYGEARPQLMDLVFEDSEEIFTRYNYITREDDTYTAEVFCNALFNHRGAWLFLKASPLLDQSGNIIGAIESIRDITERKMAVLELRESRKHYQAIVTAFDGQIYICSQDYRIVFMNEKMVERTGYNAVGEHCFKALHDLESVCPWCVNERVFKGETVKWEIQSPKDGRWYYVVNTPIHNEDGTTSKQAMIQDITDRKQAEDENRRLEQQFHHAQKLESIGVLAGGIAHDFNNILTVILGHCFMAREVSLSDQEIKAGIQQIETAANRAADLCRQMLTYAGKSQLEQTRVDLWLLIDEVVKMLQAAVKKNVAIELCLNRNVPEINGDNGQIQQVIMNLIINAAEAIGDNNGTITVRLAKVNLEADTTVTDTFGTVVLAGEFACLEVADTGCGMDEETQTRIFEPFYTTKFTGRGLGMAAIRGIVTSHDGLLHLTSAPGVGTTFKVLFPVSEASEYAEASSVAMVPPEKSGGTILLVEDEKTLRVIGTAVLETFGLSVLIAQHGREALEIYQEYGSEIDIILLDLIMPVMGGIETYQELRRIAPTLPIIICSGYDAGSVQDVITNDYYAGFVHKPYKPEELRNVMTRMMDQSMRKIGIDVKIPE